MLQDREKKIVTIVGHPFLVYFALSSYKLRRLVHTFGMMGKGLSRMKDDLDPPGSKNKRLLEQAWGFDPAGWTGDVLVLGKGFTLKVPYNCERRGIIMKNHDFERRKAPGSRNREMTQGKNTFPYLLRQIFQEEISTLMTQLDCSSLSYIKLERGERPPTSSEIEAVARLYGLDETSLVAPIDVVNAKSNQLLAQYDNLRRIHMRPFFPEGVLNHVRKDSGEASDETFGTDRRRDHVLQHDRVSAGVPDL